MSIKLWSTCNCSCLNSHFKQPFALKNNGPHKQASSSCTLPHEILKAFISSHLNWETGLYWHYFSPSYKLDPFPHLIYGSATWLFVTARDWGSKKRKWGCGWKMGMCLSLAVTLYQFKAYTEPLFQSGLRNVKISSMRVKISIATSFILLLINIGGKVIER